jgi:micrococcal nuclease
MNKKYDIIINRVIDGDSMDIDIYLGFGVVLKNRRLRLEGIDTPESRTSDEEEKNYGILAKMFVEHWCGGGDDGLFFLILNSRDDGTETDKFGRILGDIENINGESLVESILANYHGVLYHGQSKDDVKKAHLVNRTRVVPHTRVDPHT